MTEDCPGGTEGSNPSSSSGESTANLPPQWPRSNLHENASSCRSGSRTSKVSFSKPDRAARGENECSLSDRRAAARPALRRGVDSRHTASCTEDAPHGRYIIGSEDHREFDGIAVRDRSPFGCHRVKHFL